MRFYSIKRKVLYSDHKGIIEQKCEHEKNSICSILTCISLTHSIPHIISFNIYFLIHLLHCQPFTKPSLVLLSHTPMMRYEDIFVRRWLLIKQF